MKNLYITFLALVSSAVFSQTTIFSENFGTPVTSPTQISSHTFQNNTAPISFNGNATLTTLTPSDYQGASGGGCVFLGGTSPAKEIIIGGINTMDYSNITMSFGHYKGTLASTNELTISVSEDGNTWTPLTYTRATGPSVWQIITPSGTIPTTQNLRIRFENPVSNIGFRVDDIKLTGTSALNNNKNTIAGLKVYPNPTKSTLFVTSDSFSEKQVELYDTLGKIVLKIKTNNSPINLSGLSRGVYVAKIIEEEKTATRKFVIE
ncbi:T9SS type A sorting domain-containing protein [Flavobacterium amniphilum]|uniref:T9SS type A sorting domain-containing protein n=1 Tax=Flavobacterium amniphilum TaxID=1834035 RepID=UPI002029EDD4|nr:T9SS type A sorting domain-containing protein [Flavobacterium amniphilum]MCL9806061.1 T9SS type A sorting domain-containing protein [Flavobacterium amniphilum]